MPGKRKIKRENSLSLGAKLLLLLVVMESFLFFMARTFTAQHKREYILVGVSGGLQDGFPEHSKLDYHSGEADEVQAIFLGRALVRGYKAFLDVMQPTWRQYVVSYTYTL